MDRALDTEIADGCGEITPNFFRKPGLVKKDGKFGIYTYGGKLIFEPECDTIEVRSGERLFAHGVASARLDGNLVGIDAYGNVIHKYTMLTK